jgi:hypothetical protein
MKPKVLLRKVMFVKFVISILLLFQDYKPPTSKDIPIDFRIQLLKDAPNPIGILRSKGNLLFIVTYLYTFFIMMTLVTDAFHSQKSEKNTK